MTLLQQLEETGLGERAGAPGREGVGQWRGFAFTIENLNFVAPCADGLRVVSGGEVRPLPLCRKWVRGMLAVDGVVYAVIDFARFIGRRPAAANGNANLLLMAGEQFNSALLLDSRISPRMFGDDLPEVEEGGASVMGSIMDPVVAPYLRAALREGDQVWGVLDSKALMSAENFIRISRN